MTYLSLLFRSFFDAAAYRHMNTNYRGSGFGYLFFLIAIVTATYVSLALYYTHQTLLSPKEDGSSIAQKYAYEIAEQTPDIEITDGELSTTAELPYYITLTAFDEAHPIAVIDLNAKPQHVLEEDFPPILITQEAIHGRDDSKVESFYFSEMELEVGETFYLNKDIAKEMVNTALQWVADNTASNAIVLFLIFWAFFVIIWLIWATLVGLVWALILKLVARIMAHSILYEDALRLTFLILTPAYIIQTVMANVIRDETLLFMPGNGISLWLYALILLGTSVFAIRSLKSASDESE